jgi:hypothetical protein
MTALALLIAGLAMSAGPAAAERTPDMEAIYQYSFCVGATSGSIDHVKDSIDFAVKAAFESCAQRRVIAVNEVAKALVKEKLVSNEAEAASDAERHVRDLEMSMEKQLRADLATLRAKRQGSDALY